MQVNDMTNAEFINAFKTPEAKQFQTECEQLMFLQFSREEIDQLVADKVIP
jgi:hypothetical protein